MDRPVIFGADLTQVRQAAAGILGSTVAIIPFWLQLISAVTHIIRKIPKTKLLPDRMKPAGQQTG
ncbi:hypothetical protein EBAPG3_007595 [Nitrosospira lacus]|uniref:Uncharacterized protein n=1 Tax=Nitrosospira lacus TaxID=1288494 RepID=A0A1W6SPC4_9PROT|nr:hypothetical protein EBAPG3_007595 [Nitrosospira lacus]